MSATDQCYGCRGGNYGFAVMIGCIAPIDGRLVCAVCGEVLRASTSTARRRVPSPQNPHIAEGNRLLDGMKELRQRIRDNWSNTRQHADLRAWASETNRLNDLRRSSQIASLAFAEQYNDIVRSGSDKLTRQQIEQEHRAYREHLNKCIARADHLAEQSQQFAIVNRTAQKFLETEEQIKRHLHEPSRVADVRRWIECCRQVDREWHEACVSVISAGGIVRLKSVSARAATVADISASSADSMATLARYESALALLPKHTPFTSETSHPHGSPRHVDQIHFDKDGKPEKPMKEEHHHMTTDDAIDYGQASKEFRERKK